ncbi:MAG TPA: hypothetical protein VIE15_04790 [Acidimicrobiales bacterium]
MSEGLRPRPEVPPDVRAAIEHAAAEVIAQERSATPQKQAWRFSGRWFTSHPIRGRSRPG